MYGSKKSIDDSLGIELLLSANSMNVFDNMLVSAMNNDAAEMAVAKKMCLAFILFFIKK